MGYWKAGKKGQEVQNIEAKFNDCGTITDLRIPINNADKSEFEHNKELDKESSLFLRAILGFNDAMINKSQFYKK